jgi:hypothetical protein
LQQNQPQKPDFDRYGQRIEELRSSILQMDPTLLAEKTGTSFIQKPKNDGNFEFSFWNKHVSLSFPELIACDLKKNSELNAMEQATILYYFNTADGISLSDQWISFSELPDGKFYNQAFQGYTGQLLACTFQNDKDGFEQSAENLSGRHYPLGSTSYIFQILPRISLLVVQWLGDEDFPASFQILFNGSAKHYMVTDGYAILGSILTHQLIKSYRQNTSN